ncbi:MAG TPA: hypothetical protein PLD88_00765, partial [Candidatus Berkiella sp.]|nr:hypothetical protein [Candidatus Berkiella sp.]
MRRKFGLFIGTLLLIVINYPTVADDVIKYTAKINSHIGPIPVPKGSKPFIVFDEKYNPVIYFDEQPYQDKAMRCDPSMSEYYYFPVFPRIFYSPCPSRTLLAKNNNDIVWKYPLDEYEGEPIGYSTNGIVLHSFAKSKIDVLDFETGKMLQNVSTDTLKCSEYPSTAYYDKPNHLLYVYCKEGALKTYDFQKKEVATIFEPEKQF